jgi:hypothetical protein
VHIRTDENSVTLTPFGSGEIEIAVPRDRAGSFEPQLIANLAFPGAASSGCCEHGVATRRLGGRNFLLHATTCDT